MSHQLNQIIKKCKRGNRTAQAQLYKIYIDPLANVAMRYSRNQSEVQDVVHDAFINIFEGIKNFKGEEQQLYAWMLRIVINVALGRYRKQKREDLLAPLAQEVSMDGQAQILNQMEVEEIRALIAKMPDDQRVIINLYIVDQLSHQEISEILDITPSHSRTRLTRAKQKLRQLIQKQQTLSI